MQYPGMKERVERELLAMRPFQSHFKVLPKVLHKEPLHFRSCGLLKKVKLFCRTIFFFLTQTFS